MTLFSVEAPPFESLDAALRFAYRIEWEGVYPQSQIGKLHIRWKPDLTLAERRAQASLITTHVRTRCTRGNDTG